MANEVFFPFVPGQIAYFIVLNRNGQAWSLSGGSAGAFENYSSADYMNYAISATQQGTGKIYEGNFPAAIVAGIYSIVAFNQLGGSPGESDQTIAGGDFQWNGTVPLPLSDLATSGLVSQIGPIRLARGSQILNFPFKLVSSVDHITPFTSGLISGQISRDGGSFTSLQSGTNSGSVGYTEIGKGWYSLNGLTSGDLLANTVALTFSATGISGGVSDQRDFGIVLQKTSGQ